MTQLPVHTAVETAEDETDIRVRVTPKSAEDNVSGIVETPQGPALAVKVRAVPDGGKANAAVCMVIARWLGLAKTRVALVGGASSRVKTVRVELAADKVAAAIDGLAAEEA